MKALENNEQLLIFRVGPVACCVNARDVDSIVNAQKLHHLPRQADFIAGVLQYRDSAVSVVNLFHQFSLPIPNSNTHGRFVMAYTRHGVTGFWVDEIIEITNDFEQTWSDPPSFLEDSVFDQMLLWHDKFVLNTDFDRLFSMNQSSGLSEWANKDEQQWQLKAIAEKEKQVKQSAQSIEAIDSLVSRGAELSHPILTDTSSFNESKFLEEGFSSVPDFDADEDAVGIENVFSSVIDSANDNEVLDEAETIFELKSQKNEISSFIEDQVNNQDSEIDDDAGAEVDKKQISIALRINDEDSGSESESIFSEMNEETRFTLIQQDITDSGFQLSSLFIDQDEEKTTSAVNENQFSLLLAHAKSELIETVPTSVPDIFSEITDIDIESKKITDLVLDENSSALTQTEDSLFSGFHPLSHESDISLDFIAEDDDVFSLDDSSVKVEDSFIKVEDSRIKVDDSTIKIESKFDSESVESVPIELQNKKIFEQDVSGFFAENLYEQVAIYRQSVDQQKEKNKTIQKAAAKIDVVSENIQDDGFSVSLVTDFDETKTKKEITRVDEVEEDHSKIDIGDTHFVALLETQISYFNDGKRSEEKNDEVSNSEIAHEIKSFNGSVFESSKAAEIRNEESEESEVNEIWKEEEATSFFIGEAEGKGSLANDKSDTGLIQKNHSESDLKKEKAVKKVLDRIDENSPTRNKRSSLRVVASVIFVATGVFLAEHYGVTQFLGEKNIRQLVLLTETEQVEAAISHQLKLKIETVAEKFGSEMSVANLPENPILTQSSLVSSLSDPVLAAVTTDVLVVDLLSEESVVPALSDADLSIPVFSGDEFINVEFTDAELSAFDEAIPKLPIPMHPAPEMPIPEISIPNDMIIREFSLEESETKLPEVPAIFVAASKQSKIDTVKLTEKKTVLESINESKKNKVAVTQPLSTEVKKTSFNPVFDIHNVVRGDTLWAIAGTYLHNPFRYPELAKWSNIKNPDLIYPGNKVKYLPPEKKDKKE